MGIDDPVVRSLDEYAEKAVAIARDVELREDIRGRILACSHVLYESMDAVRGFERFFEHAVMAAREKRA
jgi:predicted O-linked N-acetylglucosamine transferase (SPINDLY family)